ncbi:MAG: GTPase Era [Anaerolineales bacterium]|nr:GTPase Era [Anaerolineales bacterium]MCW5856626.1 GTPase Era [Anaerolineales bacterium]
MSANFKAGFVAVVGQPNVGKSTLLNRLMGQPLAAVSPKPQTTRRNQLGILTTEEAQLVFVDTPGLHQEHNKLGALMNEQAQFALQDADVVLFLVDAAHSPQAEDRQLAERLAARRRKAPLVLAINKVDLLSSEQLAARRAEYEALVEAHSVFEISAAQGAGVDALLAHLQGLLPEGQPFYPAEQVTDLYEREITADLIRAAAMQLLREEVPHGIDVRIDQFTERGESGAHIEATIFVERDSHKGIVVGKGGAMIKQIGQAARKEIEAMSERKVFLELRVKVRPNWRNDEKSLKQFGYTRRME